MNKLFQEYYVGRKGIYHNKNVIILSANYNILEFQDFGFNFDNFEITLYFLDGTMKTETIKGNLIKKNFKLYM